MPKLIKVSNYTYEKLANYGRWADTMDSIIERLLESADNKEVKNHVTI